jgi:CARDB
LSFFDEVEEPAPEPRTASRRRRPSGSGRRPPAERQAIQIRRIIAVLVLLVVIVLIVLGVHSCQVSQTNSALKDYTSSVGTLIQQSNALGSRLFTDLANASGSGSAQNLQNEVNELRLTADNQLKSAQNLSVPDQMSAAQDKFVLAMQMRADAFANIAGQVQQALGTTTSQDAINAIAAEMARFYASDVVYKDYAAPLISGALVQAGIRNQVTIEEGQFVQDIQWLMPSFIASEMHVSSPSSSTTGKIAPGLHGHSLNSVSVNGTTLQTGATNTIPATPPAVFKFNITNGGTNNETNVGLKVTLSGSTITGQTTIPETFAGQTTSANVTLTSSPSPGSYTVTCTVEPVPGEKNLSNNTLKFPVTFS